MTINATAAWLLGALRHGRRRERGRALRAHRARPRTTSSRSTSRAAPTPSRPAPSMRLIADTVAFTVNEIPSWNPINVCSYHLQEAGSDAGPGDRLRAGDRDRRARRGARPAARSPRRTSRKVFGRISFFVNAGVRFIEEHAKLRAMGRALGGDRPRALRRHRPEVPALPLRRPGQLARPDRGPAREQRAADRARGARRHPRAATPARARSSSRPGTRRSACRGPWDQQWSLRIQQILAYETDLLDYPDIFEGSEVMDGLVDGADRGRPRRDGAPSPSTAARSRRCPT